MTRRLVMALAAAILLLSLAVRGHALHAAAGRTWLMALFLAVTATATALCFAKPTLVAPALSWFGASFFLYGFHSYRMASQIFELLVSAFALVLLVRLARTHARPAPSPGNTVVATLAVTYAFLAAGSLLLLPARVLEHRVFLEGSDFVHAVLSAFPKDPLYSIGSVDRLWLFVLFGGLLAAQADGRALCRQVARGVGWAAIAAVVLGLLDFAGVLSLDHYNLSHLFYGGRYRRLQSTFGNPSWFACFVACALPFVWLEFQEARGRARLALAAAFPACAAALFLSGARAGWLAAAGVLAALVAAPAAARRFGRPLPPADRATWLGLGSTLATLALLFVTAWTTPTTLAPSDAQKSPERLEGLSRELQYRGLGLQSPRRIAARYALELARLKPVLGLGYESFNLHLRAQLDIPGSGVSKVLNTAVAADQSETVFDDSHDTYLQVLTGTGVFGLTLWLALVAASLWTAARAFRRDPSPEALAVALGLAVFHLYGLFQGMAYIPVTFLPFPLLTAYALTLDRDARPAPPRPKEPLWLAGVLALALVAAVAGYASDRGYASLKRRFGVTAYLPDESAEFEGFYRPETGPAGEFRWMAHRGIVNVTRTQPFRLRFTCENPDADRDPVVLRLRYEDQDAGQIVFRRPGAVEQRFSFGSPGTLRLSVSRTFRPATDRRELGIAVSAIRWE